MGWAQAKMILSAAATTCVWLIVCPGIGIEGHRTALRGLVNFAVQCFCILEGSVTAPALQDLINGH